LKTLREEEVGPTASHHLDRVCPVKLLLSVAFSLCFSDFLFSLFQELRLVAIPLSLPRSIKIIRYQVSGNPTYNSVLLRLSSLRRLSSSELRLRDGVGIHGNCTRSSGLLCGDAGMFVISMPSSAITPSTEERGVRLSGLKRLLLFETDGSCDAGISGDVGGASGSVGGKML
jgi:hypothetical protein